MTPTTVIVDFSVMVHQLHGLLESMDIENEHRKAATQAQMVWLHSGEWIKRLIGHDDFNMVYVTDSKPYWRKDYLLQPDVYQGIAERAYAIYKARYPKGRKKLNATEVHYKAGRKFPNPAFTKTKNMMREIAARHNFCVLGSPGYEADDLAASLVMSNRLRTPSQQRNIVLATVDTDWMGLIDDNTTWFCSKGYDPRVRKTMSDINGWSLRRLGTTLEKPSDIWQVKTIQGDKSDNLPAGSPIEVIDLTQPPMEHRLWLHSFYTTNLNNALDHKQDRTVLPLEKATEYLRCLGLSTFIKPYFG